MVTSIGPTRSRALFIDIDGVLHPAPEPGRLGPSDRFLQVGHFGWLPELVQLLRPHPDVAVVVHSSWRLSYSDDEVREMLLELGERVIEVTPRCAGRYESILAWLDDHPVESYRIVDDDASEFASPTPPELVLCDPSPGLSSPAVQQALRAWLDS